MDKNDHTGETVKPPSAILTAFHDARRRTSREAAELVITAHGGTPRDSRGIDRSVPAANHSKCIAALERLGRDGKPVDTKASGGDDFNAIRRKAFGASRETRKPAATFESLADDAFARFNNPPTVARGDDL